MKPSAWPTTITRALIGATLLAGLAACGGNDDDAPPPVPQDPRATTTTGVIRGTESAASYSFLGIPYAAPPVGNLRWRAPTPPAAWSGERDAKAFGSNCAQPATPFGTASVSEDCLYLNVYRPKSAGPHPVMVWIHGGAFYLGQSDGYNPAALVAQGNVVVTITYRLGALGFMAHPALTTEQGGSSGNYGLMDQQAALAWVRDNIANFGGNAGNVTIFGESAGGFSVHSHLASTGSADLFHKAIIMSGAYALGAGAQSGLAASEAAGSTLANSALTLAGQSCPAPVTADCLRTSIPVAALLSTQNSVWPSGPVPTVDGTVLTQPVRDHLIAGTYSQVPVIQGTTRDEWRLFVALDEVTPATVAKPYLGAALTTTNLPDAITGTFPFLAGQAATLAAAAYNPALFGNSASLAMGALGTDLLFTCNARLSSRLQKNNASVYAYEFNDSTTPALFPDISFPMGAAHTSELNYLFNVAGRPALTTPQQAVSDNMVSAWSRFAATGNPNPAATPTAWPALGASESVLSFDAVGTTLIPDATFTATHRCSTVWTPGI